MVLKSVCAAIVCTVLLAWSGLALADEYRPDEFLGLDLSKALLAPKPLGPASQFAPGPLDARIDPQGESAQASVEPKAEPQIVVPKTRVVTRVVTKIVTRVAHVRAEKPRGAVRTKLARRHGNPLNAQAFDTRIQVWPCGSGGICNWKR
jgi:hypothetical protein